MRKAMLVMLVAVGLLGCSQAKKYAKTDALLQKIKDKDCTVIHMGISAMNPAAGAALSEVDPDCKVGRAYLDFIQQEVKKLAK